MIIIFTRTKPLVSIQNYVNSDHALLSYAFKMCFNIILLSPSMSLSDIFPYAPPKSLNSHRRKAAASTKSQEVVSRDVTPGIRSQYFPHLCLTSLPISEVTIPPPLRLLLSSKGHNKLRRKNPVNALLIAVTEPGKKYRLLCNSERRVLVWILFITQSTRNTWEVVTGKTTFSYFDIDI
jgi:hypothetical protein